MVGCLTGIYDDVVKCQALLGKTKSLEWKEYFLIIREYTNYIRFCHRSYETYGTLYLHSNESITYSVFLEQCRVLQSYQFFMYLPKKPFVVFLTDVKLA